ncbi:MAG: hypothetical protein E7Z80_00050 [Methanobrevibacter thaueri]|nr:hypothetical protein [Methanobrevibacter thaueri]
MNIIEKIKNSWWIILSLIPFINGLGFVYIGFKHNNTNWVVEGITYETPWFFYIIYNIIYHFSIPTISILVFAILLMLVSIIRSIWVAFKLADVYDNNEKYTIKQTNLNHDDSYNHENNSKLSCCFCIACIFIIIAIIIIL